MNTVDTLNPKLLQAIEKTLTRQFDVFGHTMQRRFNEINQRFDTVDRRFDEIDHRFDENDLKQNEILNAIGERFDDHEARIPALEK